MRFAEVSRRGALPRTVWIAPNRSGAGNELASARWLRNRRVTLPTLIARATGRIWTPWRVVYARKYHTK